VALPPPDPPPGALPPPEQATMNAANISMPALWKIRKRIEKPQFYPEPVVRITPTAGVAELTQ
jgi:hypothetical protein